MKFEFRNTSLNGLVVIKPKKFVDDRGFLTETFVKREFESAGIKMDVVQINHSKSIKGVLRGLHFQRRPYEQAKLVRCTMGEILDVAVDLRLASPSFGQFYSLNLSDVNRLMLYVPRGFAHGFLALTDTAEVEYVLDNYYVPEYESGIIWNDPDLAINWPVKDPILSEKDKKWPSLKELKESILQNYKKRTCKE